MFSESSFPTLAAGVDNYPAVLTMQLMLYDLGYFKTKNDLDGVFGERTTEAVERYQRHKATTIDGVVGRITWTYLVGDWWCLK